MVLSEVRDNDAQCRWLFNVVMDYVLRTAKEIFQCTVQLDVSKVQFQMLVIWYYGLKRMMTQMTCKSTE